MNITKLSLTPAYKPSPNIIIKNPEPERARRLILECLDSSGKNNNNNTKLKLQFKKLPTFIKNLVNQATYVGK